MSLSTLFFGQRKDTLWGFLTADVLVSETIDMSAEVTNHPIEVGFEITDHVILRPERIRAEFYISDQHDSSFLGSRVSTAYDILKLQRASKLVFSYVSALEIFPFCIATNISAPRTSTSGDSITFDIEIQPVRVIPPLLIPYPVDLVALEAASLVASLVIL